MSDGQAGQAPRSGAIAVPWKTLLAPFTSAKRIASGEEQFEYKVPMVDGSTTQVDWPKAAWEGRRFCYWFFRKEAAEQVTQLSGDEAWYRRWWEARWEPGSCPLACGVIVDPSETYLVWGADMATLTAETVSNLVSSATRGEVCIPTVPVRFLFTTAWQPSPFYVIAVPSPLPRRALDALQQDKPEGVPIYGEWEYEDRSPIVDPIQITKNLTKKYSEACDDYLAYTQPLTKPDHPDAKKGRIQLLKKKVADALTAIDKTQDPDGLQRAEMERFLEEYEQALTARVNKREQTAKQLLQWLTSKIMRSAEEWYRAEDGALLDGYDHYLEAIGPAHERLIESDIGSTYMCWAYNASKGDGEKQGILRVIDEFVLPDRRHSDEHIRSTFKIANSALSTWAAFLKVIGSVVTTTSETELQEFVTTMTRRVTLWLDDDLMKSAGQAARVTFEVTETLRVPVEVQKTVTAVEVREIRLTLSEGADDVLRAAQANTDKVKAVFSIANACLSYLSLREAMGKQGLLNQIGATVDFAGAIVGVLDDTNAIVALAAFRNRLTAGTATALGGKAISGRLGLLGSGLSLASASVSAVDAYNQGDWDTTAAHGLEGVGAVVTGVGTVMILLSGVGTVAVATVAIGSFVSGTGSILSVFTKDTPLDRLAKFSVFGDQKGDDADAPGWAHCPNMNFKNWNPGTVEGLERQVIAIPQILYSFQASGVEDAPSTLRIYPTNLRRDSVFRINYRITYKTEVASSTPETDPIRDGAQLTGHFNVNMAELDLANVEGNHPLVTGKSQVRRHKIGEDDDVIEVIDVTVQPNPNLQPAEGGPIDLTKFRFVDSSVFRIRLDVFGDGNRYGEDASLVVPTVQAGPERLTVRPTVNGSGDPARRASHNDEHLRESTL